MALYCECFFPNCTQSWQIRLIRRFFRGSDCLNRPSWIRPWFDAPADAHGFEVPRIQNCLLEFSEPRVQDCLLELSVKAHP